MFIYKGREYHIATWMGAKVLELSKTQVIICQGDLTFQIQVLYPGNVKSLAAPVQGKMSRSIRESISARVRYQIYVGNRQVWDAVGEMAGYEAEVNY